MTPEHIKSQPRLVLHLSGQWERKYDTLLRGDDILLRSPDISDKRGEKQRRWDILPRAPKSGAKELCEQYTKLFDGREDRLLIDPEFSLVNNHFNYGILAVAGQLEAIFEVVKLHSPTEILIFSPKSNEIHVPAVGYANLETKIGSKDTIGAIVARIIHEQTTTIPVQFFRLRGDILLGPRARRLILFIASIFVIINYSLRLMTLRRVNTHEKRFEKVILVRSKDHARHAANLHGEAVNTCALFIPQFLKKIDKSIVGDLGHLVLPSRSTIMRTLLSSFGRLNQCHNNIEITFTHSTYRFRASLESLRADYNSIPLLRYHFSLLYHSLKTYRDIREVVCFEMIGPYGWNECAASRILHIRTITRQTAMIRDSPLPLFPFSEKFFASSLPEESYLRRIGKRSLGTVKFDVPPFIISKPSEPNKFRTITYFSQPHEIGLSAKIIEELTSQATDDQEIYVKLHPRETIDGLGLNGITKEKVKILSDITAQKAIELSDLCVTRTSSIAIEAIASGKPVIHILLSQLDEDSIPDSAVNTTEEQINFINSAEDLMRTIRDYRRVHNALLASRKKLFGL